MWQGETFQTLNFSPSFALRIVMFFFFCQMRRKKTVVITDLQSRLLRIYVWYRNATLLRNVSLGRLRYLIPEKRLERLKKDAVDIW